MIQHGLKKCGEKDTIQIFSELWLTVFCVGPAAYQLIVNLLQIQIQTQDATFRKTVSPGKRVEAAMGRKAATKSVHEIRCL